MARFLVLGAAAVLWTASAVLAAEPESAAEASASQPLFSHGGRASPEARGRLAQLLQLPKDELLQELMKWPPFHQMTLQEQGNFLNRLAEMRQRLRAQALRKEAEMGLKLPPEKEESFVNAYIRERARMERKLWQETESKRRQLEEEMRANLRREYGEPSASAR